MSWVIGSSFGSSPPTKVGARRGRTSLEIEIEIASRWPHFRRDAVEIEDVEREIAEQRTWSGEGGRVRRGQGRVGVQGRGVGVRVSPGHAAEPRQKGLPPVGAKPLLAGCVRAPAGATTP